MGSEPKPEHDTFAQFIDLERGRLQKHASGTLAEALGYALPGESQEELARIAAEDQRLAQQGMGSRSKWARRFPRHGEGDDYQPL